MKMYIHIYIYTCTDTCICMCVCICTCTCTCMRMCICIYIRVHIHVCVCACACACVCVCVYVECTFCPAAACSDALGFTPTRPPKHKDPADYGFWNAPYLGPENQNLGSFCLCSLWGRCGDAIHTWASIKTKGSTAMSGGPDMAFFSSTC